MRRSLTACPQSSTGQQHLGHNLAEFVMLRQTGVTDNREDALDIRIEQTLPQDALPDHARRSDNNHFHLTVSREGSYQSEWGDHWLHDRH
jgi:hypothetical protein